MQKQIWIYGHYNIYSKTTEYQLSTYERSESSGDVLIGLQTVEFETLDDKELRIQLAKHLKQKLNVMRADHAKDEMEVMESINELSSLEFKPDAKETSSDEIPF